LSYLGIEKSILANQWIGPSSEQERNQDKLFQETGFAHCALCRFKPLENRHEFCSQNILSQP
jgi:hypothetical protein